MIGTIILILGIALLISTLVIESMPTSNKHGKLAALASKIRCSANHELALHLLVVLLVAVGFTFFVDESGNQFLLDVFPTFISRVYGWGFIIIGVLIINIVKHHRFGVGVDVRTGRILALEQMVEESPPPEHGINAAISLIETKTGIYDSDMVHELLMHLSKRNDALGEAARHKISDLGVS